MNKLYEELKIKKKQEHNKRMTKLEEDINDKMKSLIKMM